jgi:hypothetical protein
MAGNLVGGNGSARFFRFVQTFEQSVSNVGTLGQAFVRISEHLTKLDVMR